ncbi:MAG: hypothetical protein HYX67_12730 [Candidatus Melainabacteria bacterium]|nr:hypothetical protein [Candidatus Melainabacteria bacterium]
MDWFVAVFVFPEVCILLLGFFAIGVSLIGSGELDRFKRVYKPRGREVDPSYWGQYIKEAKEKETLAIPHSAAIAAATGASASGIALPKLLKAPEPQGWDKDWTGGPQ